MSDEFVTVVKPEFHTELPINLFRLSVMSQEANFVQTCIISRTAKFRMYIGNTTIVIFGGVNEQRTLHPLIREEYIVRLENWIEYDVMY